MNERGPAICLAFGRRLFTPVAHHGRREGPMAAALLAFSMQLVAMILLDEAERTF